MGIELLLLARVNPVLRHAGEGGVILALGPVRLLGGHAGGQQQYHDRGQKEGSFFHCPSPCLRMNACPVYPLFPAKSRTHGSEHSRDIKNEGRQRWNDPMPAFSTFHHLPFSEDRRLTSVFHVSLFAMPSRCN
jgi:hypothetical protein